LLVPYWLLGYISDWVVVLAQGTDVFGLDHHFFLLNVLAGTHGNDHLDDALLFVGFRSTTEAALNTHHNVARVRQDNLVCWHCADFDHRHAHDRNRSSALQHCIAKTSLALRSL